MRMLRVPGFAIMLVSCALGMNEVNFKDRDLINVPREFTIPPDMVNDILEELNNIRCKPEEYIEKLELYKEEISLEPTPNKGFRIQPTHIRDGKPIFTWSTEGRKVVDECIERLGDYIKNIKKDERRPLVHSPFLENAAQYLVRDQGWRGGKGHNDSIYGSRQKRIKSFATTKVFGENLCRGEKTAKSIVRGFLVDDGQPFEIFGKDGKPLDKKIAKALLKQTGVKAKKLEGSTLSEEAEQFFNSIKIQVDVKRSRGHRENILNMAFGTVGIAVGKHISEKRSGGRQERLMCVMDFGSSEVSGPEAGKEHDREKEVREQAD